MPRSTRIVCLLVLLSSSIFLLHALTHGPGRGIYHISPEHENANFLYLTDILVYILFLTGAWLSISKSYLLAFVLLTIGLIGRSIFEALNSLGAAWLVNPAEYGTNETAWMIIFYLLSFVLPTLLCLDCLRLHNKSKAQKNPKP